MKRPKHLRYTSQAHAQQGSGPITSKEAADERDAKAISDLLRAVLGDGSKRPSCRNKPKRKKT